ncbi:hypothetical protein HNQ51_002745 [Inhella inkyongensis]|uniref:DUF5117 domain-containing protein n=1 Tax=Inhella inkyongensis TaxID=392593 RepID=A0A840S8U6_9BURK|nr:zinc-dependent metalloprotease [Inhella inkyongensis]MBB5205426.1 hypothetical protein [Inhella inkyongensis]
MPSAWRLKALSAAALLACGLAAQAQTPATPPASAVAGARPTPPAAAPDAAEPKAYDKVITKDASTQAGLFTLHEQKGKFYFEIPKAKLDQNLLMVATAKSVPANTDHAGRALNRDVVRFVLRNHKVYLEEISFAYQGDPSRAIHSAVERSQRATVLAVVPVEAYGKDGAPVIEVSKLFTTEVGDFTARPLVRAAGLDSARSYLDKGRAFPTSLRMDAVHTYTLAPQPLPPGLPLPPGFQMPPQPVRSGTVDMAYSIVELPAQPMMPRQHDDRVGFFSTAHVDYATDDHESTRKRWIARWRLEKKDPGAALSEPVKPVVWYIDSATPEFLVPYIKKGVEAWNVAFEAAGFKNAIQARPFPTKAEDPEFDPDDVRYSLIRWVPSPVPNAYGPHLSDPRSGEILNANIVMYHNILQLQRDWYVTQAGAVDKRAQQLPLPNDLMGDLVAYVVTHEVGHSLGLPHNMKASSTYPTEKLRDPAWLKTMGHVPTLMDYSRFNYLVQPEDKVDTALLFPKVGPYDLFAVRWGYSPIAGATSPEAERATLDAWAREQDSKPWLRFTTPKAEGDLGENTEAVGDADAVLATTWGTKNLQRIVKGLPKMAMAPGRDDRALQELYRAVWGQWGRELGHVAAIVGGYETQNKHGSQPGTIATPTTRANQARAVKFLGEQILATPTWALEPTVTERLPVSEPATLLLNTQRQVLRNLLERSRTARLQLHEAQLGAKAYRVSDLLADLRGAVYSELQGSAAPSPHRRNLQLTYLGVLNERLNNHNPANADDARSAVRAELRTLQALFSAKAAQAGDAGAKAHWGELSHSAQASLDPKLAQAFAPALPLVRPGFAEESCWPGREAWLLQGLSSEEDHSGHRH